MEEIGVVKNPHEHPLVLYQFGQPYTKEEGRICSHCQTQWNPPGLRCHDCDYCIHHSCIQTLLPARIQTPLHRQHSTPLLRHRSNSYCHCCGHPPVGDTYKCPLCDFVIDYQCAIADTKASGLTQLQQGDFRHFSHVHPLLLIIDDESSWSVVITKVTVCFVCDLLIKPGSTTYYCEFCKFHVHKQCAKLAREIQNSEIHQHPLFLFAKSFDGDNLCNNCRNHCFKFFYSCTAPLCKFKLHVSCVSSFKHQHDFLPLLKAIPYTCQFCGKNNSTGCPWSCSICQLFADKQCVKLPISLRTLQHDHELNLTFSHGHQDTCKICSERIDVSFARYTCNESGCGFDAHLDCAKLQQKCVQDEEVDIDKVSKFVGHEHELTLRSSKDNVHCNGCMQCIITESYGCPPCEFNLHEDCAKLRRQRIILPLHSHKLRMLYIPDFMFLCSVCHQYCHGFVYYCKQCHYAIDIRCAAITFPFKHSSHNHPLFPLKDGLSKVHRKFGRTSESLRSIGKHKCRGCGDVLTKKFVFGCDDCKFYLDAKCANLPLAVRNRFDEHPLALTFENDEDEEELYCDVCEEKREKNEWFYNCKMCYFAAHLRCALGDYPFVKSDKFEGHRHLLNLVKEGKKGYSNCGACGHSCEGSLAFECEHCICKFNVHAFGSCYHNQLAEGRITFTMPSLYSRSLPLYLDPIERKRSKSILLGGNNGGAWKERDFSGITKFMVDHGRWDDSIGKQYDTDKIEDEDEARHRGSTSKVVNKHEIKTLNYLKNEDDLNYNDVLMSLGEYGGLGGMHWYDEATFDTVIKTVEITSQNFIISISTQYYNEDEKLLWCAVHGGNPHDGDLKSTVKLDPDEFLISVKGYMDDHEEHDKLIRSLTLVSNKKIHGPFGREEGTRFCFPTNVAEIVGFHGRSSNYLNSIGIIVVPISQPQSHGFGVNDQD